MVSESIETYSLQPKKLQPNHAGLNSVSLSDGNTTRYLYDHDLTDDEGLDNSTGVSIPKFATGSSGSFSVSLADAITKLADTVGNGGAGTSFGTNSPGSASVVINAEDEISFTISDSAGRAVMSGKLNTHRGSGATALNTLASWTCTLHDALDEVTDYGDCLETKSIDSLGNTTKALVDGAGRTIKSIDQANKTTSMTYDASGNQLSIRDPNNVGADMLYDAMGRNTQRTDTDSDVTKTEYDLAGNAVKQIDAKNKNTIIVFDPRQRRKSVTDRISGVTSFTYTALSQLASLTDAESQTTSYTYDARGSKTVETYPDHTGGTVGQSTYGKINFVYDNAGRVKRREDQLGDTCTYTFDLAGRMTQRDYRTAANSPTGTIADSDTFTFDRAGRMLTAVSGRYSNTVTYTYDPSGRKASEALTISSQTYTVGTEYNSRNELTKYTLPDSSTTERSYHPTGALHLLKIDGNTVSTRTYDDGRRLTSDVLGNGVTETRTYGTDNLLTGISYSGASIGDMTYTWDANKNKTSESISGTMSGYGFTSAGTSYDDEDRLTGYARANSNLTQSWSLSAVGDWNSITTNGTSQSRTHGATHELTVAGGNNVTTDVKGNITVLPANLVAQSSTLGLVYDFDNKMKSADVGNNSSVDVEYKYDALGRRVGRSGSSGSYAYVQVDQQTLVDYGLGDSPSSPLYRYVYGSYIDEPVVRKGAGSGGTIYYYHRNQQYSVTAITNSSAGIVERYAYQAYREPTILDASASVLSSSSISNRYTYTGREWDGTIGLYHFRARWMSGLTGRFLSRDPIGFEGSQWGLYELFDGLVFKSNDPSGLASVDCTCNCGGGPSAHGAPVEISTNCNGDTDTCCRQACDMTMSFCVYKSLPGEAGGASGEVLKPAEFKDGKYLCDQGRCEKRIQHLRCGYFPSDCSKLQCKAGCLAGGLACGALCDRIWGGNPRTRRKLMICRLGCGAVSGGCSLLCDQRCTKP